MEPVTRAEFRRVFAKGVKVESEMLLGISRVFYIRQVECNTAKYIKFSTVGARNGRLDLVPSNTFFREDSWYVAVNGEGVSFCRYRVVS